MRNEYFNGYNPEASLYLCYCGYENCPPGHGVKPHIRDCYLVHYVISGTCHIHFEDEDYVAEGGDYFIIPPGKLVSYHDDGTPMSYYWYGFNGPEADQFYEGILKRQVIVRATQKEETVRLIKDCLTEKNKTFVNQLRLLGNLYLLLSLFEQPIQNNAAENEKKNDLIVEQALSYIHHNYMKGLTVHKIAEYLNIERTSFSKIFKRKVGLTAIEYISNCQLDKALELIKTTNLSFMEISNLSGICDPYYFTKLVKNRTGVTPSQYRKNFSQEQSEQQ